MYLLMLLNFSPKDSNWDINRGISHPQIWQDYFFFMNVSQNTRETLCLCFDPFFYIHNKVNKTCIISVLPLSTITSTKKLLLFLDQKYVKGSNTVLNCFRMPLEWNFFWKRYILHAIFFKNKTKWFGTLSLFDLLTRKLAQSFYRQGLIGCAGYYWLKGKMSEGNFFFSWFLHLGEVIF